MPSTIMRAVTKFTTQNVKTARLILQQADQYPPGSLAHRWATTVTERVENAENLRQSSIAVDSEGGGN